jgi:hypothetical protein
VLACTLAIVVLHQDGDGAQFLLSPHPEFAAAPRNGAQHQGPKFTYSGAEDRDFEIPRDALRVERPQVAREGCKKGREGVNY